jgi:hypothetical protein
MKRKKPSFNEEYHGYRTFSDLLEDAQRYGLLDLERHKTSGTYVITRFGSEPRQGGTAAPTPRPITAPPAPPRQPPPVRPPAPAKPPAAKEPAPARGGERRGGGRRPAQEKPAQAPAPPPGAEDEDRLPLGRALIDDIDLEENGGDDIPSYMPRKGTPPTAKPAKPAQQPAGRAPRGAKPATPAKPKPEAKPSQQPARGSRSQPARRSEEPKPTREAKKPAVEPRPTPRPAPPADEDAEFGAGLDL